MKGSLPDASKVHMWPYIPRLLETPVPRYTSYPTAAEFGDEIVAADVDGAYSELQGEVSLYVHIPFCDKICWYCGCNTGAANKKQRLASYLDALHREIQLVARKLPDGVKVGRISFGGGSPNAIAPVDFVRLFDAITLAFPLGDLVTSAELDPRSLTADWVAVLGSVGVTRASLGVQTFAPHCQEAIGRIQPLCMIEKSARLLRSAGVASLNFDLMYGLPSQSETDLANSLRLALDLGADRLAVFGYAHVPHLIERQRRIDASALPGVPERFAMAELAHNYLTAAGFEPVGFDHFARPDDPLAHAACAGSLRRNFQGFTDDCASTVIGLGASSINSFSGLLVQNEKNSGRYRMMLSQDRLPIGPGVKRDRDDQIRGRIIEDLLCRGRARVESALLQSAWSRLAPFVEEGVCSVSGAEVIILPHGIPYARGIAAVFDPHRETDGRKFSSAV